MVTTCSVNECGAPIVGRELCSKHWQRWKKHGTTELPERTPEERFWAKVDKTDTCWNWTGFRKPDGYGRWRPEGQYGKAHYVHRVAWEFLRGPIPEGKQLDHKCHNTSCVRPDHLRLTTPKQNQEHRVKANKGNPSGVRGVTRHGNRWVARVRHEGRNHIAGYFATIPEAEAAVIALRQQLFTHSDMDRIAA